MDILFTKLIHMSICKLIYNNNLLALINAFVLLEIYIPESETFNIFKPINLRFLRKIPPLMLLVVNY